MVSCLHGVLSFVMACSCDCVSSPIQHLLLYAFLGGLIAGLSCLAGVSGLAGVVVLQLALAIILNCKAHSFYLLD